MLFLEALRMAFSSLLQHKLRSIMTLLSMAIGVFAIVGVSGAIDVLKASLNDGLVAIGRDDFLIERSQTNVGAFRQKTGPPILLREALRFKEGVEISGPVGLSLQLGATTVSLPGLSTDGDVSVVGVDENYLLFDDRAIKHGRGVDAEDLSSASPVVVIGPDVAERLKLGRSSIGKELLVDKGRYRLIGITDAKGSVMGMSQDNMVLLPITTARRSFSIGRRSTSIVVRSTQKKLERDIGESVGLMRGIRRVPVARPDNFRVVTQGEIEESIGGFTRYIVFFGAFCGVVALLAAGIGIMNIMLVSVKERTKEIGLRKAVGARSGTIMTQFVVEAVTICQLGAFLGILLGLLAGAALAVALDVDPVAPSTTLVWSVLLCGVIGLTFGSYPAWKASRMDPIESLRYE